MTTGMTTDRVDGREEEVNAGVDSLMQLSESKIGHLASRIVHEMDRSKRRAQTLSPGANEDPLMSNASLDAPLSKSAACDHSFAGWPDAKWPDFSASILATAGAGGIGEEVPTTPAQYYRIRTPSSGSRARSRSSSPEVPRQNGREINDDRRDKHAVAPSKGWEIHFTPKAEPLKTDDVSPTLAKEPAGASGGSPDTAQAQTPHSITGPDAVMGTPVERRDQGEDLDAPQTCTKTVYATPKSVLSALDDMSDLSNMSWQSPQASPLPPSSPPAQERTQLDSLQKSPDPVSSGPISTDGHWREERPLQDLNSRGAEAHEEAEFLKALHGSFRSASPPFSHSAESQHSRSATSEHRLSRVDAQYAAGVDTKRAESRMSLRTAVTQELHQERETTIAQYDGKDLADTEVEVLELKSEGTQEILREASHSLERSESQSFSKNTVSRNVDVSQGEEFGMQSTAEIATRHEIGGIPAASYPLCGHKNLAHTLPCKTSNVSSRYLSPESAAALDSHVLDTPSRQNEGVRWGWGFAKNHFDPPVSAVGADDVFGAQDLPQGLSTLQLPETPTPLTPMGYTPRRTQLDDPTLRYLMRKWCGQRVNEQHEILMAPGLNVDESKRHSDSPMNPDTQQVRMTNDDLQKTDKVETLEVASPLREHESKTKSDDEHVRRTPAASTLQDVSGECKPHFSSPDVRASLGSDHPLHISKDTSPTVAEGTRSSRHQRASQPSSAVSNRSARPGRNISYSDSTWEWTPSPSSQIPPSSETKRMDRHVFEEEEDENAYDGGNESPPERTKFSDSMPSDAANGDGSQHASEDRYDCENSLSTECPSIRESLMAASCTSSASSSRTRSVGSWRRTLDAESPAGELRGSHGGGRISAPSRTAPLIHVDTQELMFVTPHDGIEACREQVLLVCNVSGVPLALSYCCLDGSSHQVPSKFFSVHSNVLDTMPVLAPRQTSSLTIFCNAYGCLEAGEGDDNAGGSVLAIVAMPVSEVMKQGVSQKAYCEHVRLCVVPPVTDCVSPLLRKDMMIAQSSSPLETCWQPSCVSSHSVIETVAEGNSRGVHARTSDDVKDNEKAVSSPEEDLWFVDTSAIDLGRVYIQDTDRRVISVPSSAADPCECLVSVVNPSRNDMLFQVQLQPISCQPASSSASCGSNETTFLVGPAGDSSKATSSLVLTVPARQLRQLQIFIDTSSYDFSGCKVCKGELCISRLKSQNDVTVILGTSQIVHGGSRGGSKESTGNNRVCVKLSCTVGFCRLQIPGHLEEVHFACALGGKAKQTIALRNNGCLPATVRLSIEDEEDALGRPLALLRGIFDDSFAGCGEGSMRAAAQNGGSPADGVGIFRVKQTEVRLEPDQVTKVVVALAPPQDKQVLMHLHGAGDLMLKSRLVLRVAEDRGVHYSVPLCGQVDCTAPAVGPHAALRFLADPPPLPGLPLSCAPPLQPSHRKGGGIGTASVSPPPGGPHAGSMDLPVHIKEKESGRARGSERRRHGPEVRATKEPIVEAATQTNFSKGGNGIAPAHPSGSGTRHRTCTAPRAQPTSLERYSDQGPWEDMAEEGAPLSRAAYPVVGIEPGGVLPAGTQPCAGGLIVPFGEEEDTWPPWKWAEEECDRNGREEGRAGKGGVCSRAPSCRASFPDTRIGELSVIKIALCNRSRKDAVVTIDTCHKSATSSAFRLRHREVHVKAEQYLMLPIYFVPVERGKARDKLTIRSCSHSNFSRCILLSASAV